MAEKHIIHIRDIDEDLYELLWNLRKYYKAKSWHDLLKKICEEYKQKMEEVWY